MIIGGARAPPPPGGGGGGGGSIFPASEGLHSHFGHEAGAGVILQRTLRLNPHLWPRTVGAASQDHTLVSQTESPDWIVVHSPAANTYAA